MSIFTILPITIISNKTPIDYLQELYNEIKQIDNRIVCALDNLYTLHNQDMETLEGLRGLFQKMFSLSKELKNLATDSNEYQKKLAEFLDIRKIVENGRIKRREIRLQYLTHSTTLKIASKEKEDKAWQYNLLSGIYIYWEDEASVLPRKITQETNLEI